MFLMLGMAVCPTSWALTESEEKEIRAEADNFQYSTKTTKEGLQYRVPEDMPIETRNGIQAPIPFDEYMYSKFKKIDTRLDAMDKKLDNIQKILLGLKKEDKQKLPDDGYWNGHKAQQHKVMRCNHGHFGMQFYRCGHCVDSGYRILGPAFSR